MQREAHALADADPFGFNLSDVLDVNFQPKIDILLMEEGSEIRGLARQIMGRVDPSTYCGWIYLAIKQRWPDLSDPCFSIEGEEVVTEHQTPVWGLGSIPCYGYNGPNGEKLYCEIENSGGLLLVVDVHERFEEHFEGNLRGFVKRFGMNMGGRLLGPDGALYGPLLIPW